MGIYKSKKVNREDKFIKVGVLRKLLSNVNNENIVSVDEHGDLTILYVTSDGKARSFARIDIATERLMQLEGSDGR